jgi:hypothetical protein
MALYLIITSAFMPGVQAQQANAASVDFFGEKISFTIDPAITQFVPLSLSGKQLDSMSSAVLATNYQPIVEALLAYRNQHQPDDWLYYQLIRKTAEVISPKKKDYHRYTFFKWFLLTRSGFDATLNISGNKILFYVRCDENIYNIPSRLVDGRQYVCLNYHDYLKIDFNKESFAEVSLPMHGQQHFSYQINKLPEFKSTAYLEKELRFYFYEAQHQLKVRLNPEVNAIFANYPVVDYKYSLNIPLSKETYQSLIPILKKQLSRLNPKNGVDYLRRFTRDAFMFDTDTRVFGGEKRLSPEETLLSPQSDCEDRVALFYCLVKEIYDLPMIVLAYPDHVTIAVQFEKAVGKTILYNGNKYTICEPTPQKQELGLGKLLPGLENQDYTVAYVYSPADK